MPTAWPAAGTGVEPKQLTVEPQADPEHQRQRHQQDATGPDSAPATDVRAPGTAQASAQATAVGEGLPRAGVERLAFGHVVSQRRAAGRTRELPGLLGRPSPSANARHTVQAMANPSGSADTARTRFDGCHQTDQLSPNTVTAVTSGWHEQATQHPADLRRAADRVPGRGRAAVPTASHAPNGAAPPHTAPRIAHTTGI